MKSTKWSFPDSRCTARFVGNLFDGTLACSVNLYYLTNHNSPSFIKGMSHCTQFVDYLTGLKKLTSIHLYHSAAILESLGNKGFVFVLSLPVQPHIE